MCVCACVRACVRVCDSQGRGWISESVAGPQWVGLTERVVSVLLLTRLLCLLCLLTGERSQQLRPELGLQLLQFLVSSVIIITAFV